MYIYIYCLYQETLQSSIFQPNNFPTSFCTCGRLLAPPLFLSPSLFTALLSSVLCVLCYTVFLFPRLSCMSFLLMFLFMPIFFRFNVHSIIITLGCFDVVTLFQTLEVYLVILIAFSYHQMRRECNEAIKTRYAVLVLINREISLRR